MASRKKQEDKHLKILRDLAGQPHNKKCFDCGQRGPTYVNMTIGAFVCTSCSGLLRGLNPPHRIKSISMATFASQEIEFLQNHGNEVCRQTWLALWNSSLPPEPESRDEQKMRDFLITKYERKSWYSSQPRAKTNPAPVPEAKPLKQLLGDTSPAVLVNSSPAVSTVSTASVPTFATTFQRTQPAAPPPVAQPPEQPVVNQVKTSTDLLGDLGSDPFAPSQTPSFNAFQPISSGQPQPPTQPQRNHFVDPFSSSPGHSAAPPFNAFGTSTSHPAQSASGGLDIFGTDTGISSSSSTGFNAFGNPATQVATSSFANFSSDQGLSASDRYEPLSQLDYLFRGNNTQSVFTSGPASSPVSGTNQPNPFMSPASGTSGAVMLQKQQQVPPNPFQTPVSQPLVSGFGNNPGFGMQQAFSVPNAVQGSFRAQNQTGFVGGQSAFGGAPSGPTQQPFGGGPGSGGSGQNAFNQPGFGTTQSVMGSNQGFVTSQGGFSASAGGFGNQASFGSNQSHTFGMQSGFGTGATQGAFGGSVSTQLGGFQGGSMQVPGQMLGMNQATGQPFGGMGGGFSQQNAMQQPSQFGSWQQPQQHQAMGVFGSGGGLSGPSNMGGFGMGSQPGMQKATNPFM